MKRLLLFVLLGAAPAVAEEAPKMFVMALPARVELVAVLPVEKGQGHFDLVDLDLRVEVVLPRGCGDKVAGLMKRNGATLEGADEYDVILERRPLGECKKDATRVGARWAIRMRVADGATRTLTLGERVLKVARAGEAVTLDGEAAVGDVPGAPPTGKPATFVAGAVTAARAIGQRGTISEGQPAAVVDVEVSAKWLKCIGDPVGFMARGDAASKFALTHFEPLAIAPLDGSCAGAAKARVTPLQLVWRGAGDYDVTVGEVRLHGKPPAAQVKK